MLISLTLFTIAVSVTGLVIYFKTKKEQQRKDLYPLQMKVLSELLQDIRTQQLSLYVLNGSRRKAMGVLTVSELGKSLESKEEFAKEEYDDHKLFFTRGTEPLPGLDKYIGNGILPKNIRSELKDFLNTRYEKANLGSTPCFILAPQGQQLFEDEPLVEGNAEAFESWLTFRERANNIEFMVQQWVSENSDQAADFQKVTRSTKVAGA